jgi:hypothetical protein
MYSTVFIGIIFLLIQSSSGDTPPKDSRIIIGSSVGGALGLVSEDLKKRLTRIFY